MRLTMQAMLPLAVFTASLVLTGWFRRHAMEHMLDIPNARSSHTTATPRGGGVAIVISTLLALLFIGFSDTALRHYAWGFIPAGAAVAIVGFADDRNHVPARWRLLGHFSSAIWILAILHGAPPIDLFGLTLHTSSVSFVLACLFLVWMLNLTNFMDGIDGIAGVEAITACCSGALLAVAAAPAGRTWIFPAILAAASLGFLCWNWPPAKIFMGDAGSGFLGLMLGAFALQAGWTSAPLFWSWLILLGVFIVDATITLAVRVARGERFYEAHRSHAYQHAAVRRGSHLPVTIAVALINVCWLLPIAYLVASSRIGGAIGLLVAYLPLATGAILLRAGTPESA